MYKNHTIDLDKSLNKRKISLKHGFTGEIKNDKATGKCMAAHGAADYFR